MHEAMAATLDIAVEQIRQIQQDARAHSEIAWPRWPMILLNSPKGWTGPMSDPEFDALFTTNKPIILAFHA
jgi:phosphoketolase